MAEEKFQDLATYLVKKTGDLQYFTKNELKYRFPEEKFEQIWLQIKQSRTLSQVCLPCSAVPLTYVLTNEIVEELHVCDSEKSSLEISYGLHHDDDYIATSLSAEAISSSQLEGATTTEVVAREMLRKNRQPRSRSERMIINNHHALQFIRNHLSVVLTPEFICEVQKIVTDGTLEHPDDARRFRTSDDIRVINRTDGRIIHEPPKAAKVPELIDAVCSFINRENTRPFVHPLIAAIALHFLIGYIHPFTDGNGRTARCLFYWYMLSKGYVQFAYLPISRVIVKAPAKYRDAYLATEDDDLDLTYFVQYLVRCIRKSRESFFRNLADEQKRRESLLQSIGKLPDISPRQEQILIYALDHQNETISIDEIARRFSVVYQTARTDLMHLYDCGYLCRKKESRAFRYILNPAWYAQVSVRRN